MDIPNNLKEKISIYNNNTNSDIVIKINNKDKSLLISLDTFAFSLKSLTDDTIKFFNSINFECFNTDQFDGKNPIIYLEGNYFTLQMRFTSALYFGICQCVLLKLIK